MIAFHRLDGQLVKLYERPNADIAASHFRCATDLATLGHQALTRNSFLTVSALPPTLAIAASISSFDFLNLLRQYRANAGVETSTLFRSTFEEDDVKFIY